MNRPGMSLWLSSAATVAVVTALDQWTKAWALAELRGQAPRTVVPGFFDLTFNRNTGGVFGVLALLYAAACRQVWRATAGFA